MGHYRDVDAFDPKLTSLSSCGGGWLYEPHVAENIFNQLIREQEPRLRLLLRHEAREAVMHEQRITGAIFTPRDQPEKPVHISATVVIDATYEADLAAFTKAEFRIGRESRDELGEPHAGRVYMHFASQDLLPGSTGEGDKAIQSFCFRFSATADESNGVPVEKPAGYDRDDYRYLLEDIRTGKLTNLGQVFGVYPMPRNKVELNSQNPLPKTGLPSESLDLAEECWPWPLATPAQRRKLYERYLTHNVGMLWLLQNDSEITPELQRDARRYAWCKDEFVTNNHLPRQLYMREGRRFVGTYLLTEHDGELAPGLERTRVQTTSIGLVEWAYDSHACHRYDPAHPGVREGYTFVTHPPFQIPYGVVVPKIVDGLLIPLACSASHVAYNGLRNEPIYMILGEACGAAAHLAVQQHVQLREISVDRLQRQLVENGSIITYLEDLESLHPAAPALQWLGARGYNTGYRADADLTLTRGEAAARLNRVLQNVHAASQLPELGGDRAAPILLAEAQQWVQSVGFHFDTRRFAPRTDDALTVAQFATLLYSSMAFTGESGNA
jgi:hypothetical protein